MPNLFYKEWQVMLDLHLMLVTLNAFCSVHYTKYDTQCLIIFRVVTTVSCSTLIFHSLIISVIHKCIAPSLLSPPFASYHC